MLYVAVESMIVRRAMFRIEFQYINYQFNSHVTEQTGERINCFVLQSFLGVDTNDNENA